MAMINCYECGTEVNSKAKICPKCGISRPGRAQTKESGSYKGLIAVVVFAVIVLVLVNILPQNETVYDSAGSSSSSSTSRSSSVSSSDARKICDAFRATDVPVSCSVFEGARTIKLIVNMDPSEAQQFCAGYKDEVRRYTNQLGGWSLRIYSPRDTGSPIASCRM